MGNRDGRTRVLCHEAASAAGATCAPASLKLTAGLTADDGERHEVRVDANRGGPGNPLSAEEHAAKFRLNAGRVLDAHAVSAVSDAVLALPDRGAIGPVMDLVGG